ncbi:hypothetical protein [Marichromatium sp. AB31]|uniref:hypothetical protein n=1 Tax=Marichromatium sp. AB31 TaxID=2483362 RepID=UPI0011CE67E2|nr:hypothetical protein [Marichromatium sp. AB31]
MFKLSKKDKLGLLLIIAGSVILIFYFYFFELLKEKHKERDDETLCTSNKNEAHYVFIIDNHQLLDDGDRAKINNFIMGFEFPCESRVTIYSTSELKIVGEDGIFPIFDKCKPDDGAACNPFYQGCRRIEQ